MFVTLQGTNYQTADPSDVPPSFRGQRVPASKGVRSAG